jgi:hypothetical protein
MYKAGGKHFMLPLGRKGFPITLAEEDRVFYRDLASGSLGDGPTVARTTTAYVKDWEGLLKQLPAGAAQIENARPVYNLIRNTGTAGAAVGVVGSGGALPTNWQKSAGGGLIVSVVSIADNKLTLGISGTPSQNWIAFYLDGFYNPTEVIAVGNVLSYSVNLSASGSGINSANLTIDQYNGGTWLSGLTSSIFSVSASKRFSHIATLTNPLVSRYGAFISFLMTVGSAVNCTIEISCPQVTQVAGQSNQNPAEYVPRGVSAGPYPYGVDGLNYFFTQNYNSVANNIVTEGTGLTVTCANWYSEAIENWTLHQAGMVTVSESVAPHGRLARAVAFSASAGYALESHTISVAAGGVVVLSYYAKNNSGSFGVKVETVSGAQVIQFVCDTSTGLFSSKYTASMTEIEKGSSVEADGWRRYYIVASNDLATPVAYRAALFGSAILPSVTISGVNLCAGFTLFPYIYTGAGTASGVFDAKLTGPFPLVLEPAATCSNQYSETLENWGGTAQPAVSVSTAMSPCGVLARQIAFTASTGGLSGVVGPSIGAGLYAIGSFFAKDNSGSFLVRIRTTDSTIRQEWAVNTAAGTLVAAAPVGSMSRVSDGVLASLPGWKRYWFCAKNESAGALTLVLSLNRNTDASPIISGANLCAGQNLTSYIKADAVAVTRNQDVVSWPLVTPQAEGVVVVKARMGFARAVFPSDHAILSFNTPASTLIYIYGPGGALSTYDGTTGITVEYSWADGAELLIAVRYNTATSKRQIGVKPVGSGTWTWSAEGTYDGSFASSNIVELKTTAGLIKASAVSVYNKDKGRAFIEENFL